MYNKNCCGQQQYINMMPQMPVPEPQGSFTNVMFPYPPLPMPGDTDMGMPMQQSPMLPTGFPTGGSPTPLTPSIVPGVPASLTPSEPPPETLESPLYTPGFLRTMIGKKMRVEFLMGTGALIDRTGTLAGVGVSYILLQPLETDDILLCDIYSIRFVTILL